MRNKFLFFIFCFLGLCATQGWSADLKVISAKPIGTLDYTGRTPVSITFNQPVVALSEESAFSAADCPLQIVPATDGTCRFSGTQTLQFEPAQDWTEATEYQVTLLGGFASRVGKGKLPADYHFSFTTQRPRVRSVLPSDKEQWIDVRPLIFVTLNQPVNLASAQRALRVTYPGPSAAELTWWEKIKAYLLGTDPTILPSEISVPFRVRALTEEEFKENFSYQKKDHIFVAELEKDLPPDTKIMLTVSRALRGQSGTLGPEKDFTSVFYTYPKLQLVGGDFEGCLPFDAAIYFSSPVRLADLLKHIKISPQTALAEVTPQDAQTLGYQRYVSAQRGHGEETDFVSLPVGTGYFALPLSFLRLEPEQDVVLTFDKELTDIYGQKLGVTQEVRLHNEGYCPAVTFKGGTGVLESYLPARHPIDLLNENALEVSAGRFNSENIINFLERDPRYCQPKEIAAANLQYKGNYSFDITRNKTKKTYLDLQKFHPTARDSVIYSQVRVPSKYRQDGYCWEGATDNITDLGVSLKTSPENILVWVTSLRDAAPRAGLQVQLRDRTNRVLWNGETDENGLALAPGTQALQATSKYRWDRPTIYALVTSPNGDAVLSSAWDDGIEPWRFNIPFSYGGEAADFKTALFTERGIYRPGEKVYVAGLTRKEKNGEWIFPSLSQGVLTVYNSREEKVFEKTISYRDRGIFDWNFVLPQDAATGIWQLNFSTSQGADATVTFRVEAVKQADFEVHLRALEKDFFSGEKAAFTLSADYLFGAPAAGAQAKWTVRYKNDWFHPKGYEEYEFNPYFLSRDENEEDNLLSQASGELDAQGKLNFSVQLPKVTGRQLVYAEAGVQAPTGQQLFARSYVPLNPADFYIGAHTENWAVQVGEEIAAHVIALNVNGQPAGPVQVRADIQKEEYFSVRKNGLAGRLEWVSERKTKDISSQSFTVDKSGYDFSFLPQQPGRYQITLSAQDKQGRRVRGGFEVTVYGKGESYWRQNNDDILQLKAEKDAYQPGENARILVESPYEKATALITVERNGILDKWVKNVSSGADFIEIPIKESYVPNVFVGVTLVRGRAAQPEYDKEGLDLAKPQGKTGYARLTVSQASREVQTRVETDRAAYQPGENVNVTIHTSNRGKPVAADVIVSVVDEGILSLTGYKLPNLLGIFYAPASLNVSTADNRLFLIGQRNFGEKGENRGGGGGLLNKLGGTDLRSHFEFTPYFNARVRSDGQGIARVQFKLPDNLTTFRIMAVSATQREFGAGETSVKVSKPLMITPKMPRFARRGDEFRCGAVVYNYEDNSGELTVSARAGGVLQLSGGEQKIRVEKGGAKEISWPCQTPQAGTAQVAFSVKGAQARDGVQIKFPVTEVEKKQTLALYADADTAAEQLLQRPASVNEQVPSEVSLSLASTALINLRGGMLYLLTYPYDCLEQKMSKILPVIEGAELVEDFKLGDTSDYKQQVQKILQQLPMYQAVSGGYAYWPDGRADLYVTAYALETAHRARQAGYTVPEASLQKATKWLRGVFGTNLRVSYPYAAAETKTMQAYAVYVLSLYGEKQMAQFNTLYSQRNALSVPAQAYLLLAAQTLNAGEDIEKELAQGLMNQAVFGAQTIHFASQAPQPWLHMGDVKVTALVLEALLRSGQELPQPYQVVRWLTEQLLPQGYWINTNTNAAVFSALNTYYRLKETQTPDFTATAQLNGRPAFSARFEGRSLQTQEKQWSFAQVYAGGEQARLQLEKSGPGTLYYTLAQSYAPEKYDRAINAGFAVSRQITDLKGNPVTGFHANQRYKVTLKTITSAAYSFVVLEDFLPAGFEPVTVSLATESAEDAASLDNGGWGNFERDEKYDDRIVIFADYLAAGEHTYSYLVQATVAGTFSYPSVWASQMYDPAVFGRNETSALEIKP